jgi:hypothetical protein
MGQHRCFIVLFALMATASAAAFAEPFTDVTDDVGLSGMSGLAGAWGDYNNDGWVDLYVSKRLYRNDQGKFTEVEGHGIDGLRGGLWADFDNDGDLDMYCWFEQTLYRQDDEGKFTNVTAEAIPELPMQSTWGACWGDFDGDGFVDLYISGWEEPSYQPDAILHNNRDGTFKLVWQTTNKMQPSRGITGCDFDNDGDLDVFVSNYRLERNLLWVNDGDGNFTNGIVEYEAEGDGDLGAWGHTIGSSFGDFDNDGNFDLFVGNFSHPPAYQDRPMFYRNRGGAHGYTFENKTDGAGLHWQESYACPTLADFDNDGHLDLYFSTVYSGDSSVLYRNNGDWTFTDVTADAGVTRPTSYQAAWADFDNDGDVDLLAGGRLFANPGSDNHWLKVRLVGAEPINRTAIGAQVRIQIGERTFARQIEGAVGESNHNDQTLHFGLGTHSEPVTVHVRWPDGGAQQVTTDVDMTVTIEYRSMASTFNFPPAAAEGEPDYFTIAEDGESRCVIVVPTKASREEARASRMLKLYLEQITSGSFAVVTEDKVPNDGNAIYLGNTQRGTSIPLDLPPARYGDSELPNVNGFLITTPDESTLIIRGQTPAATIFGVVGLLKQYAGVRRYWPGEPGGIGDVVPKSPTLRLPRVTWRDWPYFISRIMSGLGDRGPQSDTTKWATFSEFWRMNYTIPSNESYYRLMKTADHIDEPALFPVINGERFVPTITPGERVPHGWQPCVSNPRAAEIMAESAREYFAADPMRFAISLSVNDGYGDCRCDACRAMDPPGADINNRILLCDRYVKFNNRVIEQANLPGKIFAFLAYGSMRTPPTETGLHSQLAPVLCVWGNAFAMWDSWVKFDCEHMGIYLYHDDMWFVMPKFDVRQSAKRIDYFVRSGKARHFYQEYYGIYPLNGMVGYVEKELCWDPRQDVNAITREYYRDFFGSAADSMRAFYDTVEAACDRWMAREGDAHPHGYDHTPIADSKSMQQFAVLPIEDAEAAQQHLVAAMDAAGDDALVRERIELVKMLFDFAVPGCREYWAVERINSAQVADADGAQALLDDARTAIDASLAIAQYRDDVMMVEPAKTYAKHTDSDVYFHNLRPGAANPITLSHIGAALTRAVPAVDGAWWQERIDQEPRTELADMMRAALYEAQGKPLDNLVRDASFEDRGARIISEAVQSDLPPNFERPGGVSLWHSEGTPFEFALTDERAHEGKYSATFHTTQLACISESRAVEGGETLKMSVWVNRNDADAKYTVTAIPRRPSGMLTRMEIPVPHEPDQWQRIEMIFNVPPDATTVGLYVFVESQVPGAQIWIDDMFIGQYQ